MFRNIIVLLLLVSCPGYSQIPKPSRYEYSWAIIHPFAAIKVKKITKKCMAVSFFKNKAIDLDTFINGGKLDAHRHAFYMAAYSQKIKVRKLRKLGKAHEKTNYRQFLRSEKEEGGRPDSLGSVMDLRNNELGFTIGSSNKKLKLDDLSRFVVSEIKTGKAFIVKRDKQGNYLDCDGKKIDLNIYRKTWSIPKCILPSDFQP